MEIKGTKVREVVNPPPHPSFWIYEVTLVGGPHQGLVTLAGNTTEVYFQGACYVLKDDGRFHYEPDEIEPPQ